MLPVFHAKKYVYLCPRFSVLPWRNVLLFPVVLVFPPLQVPSYKPHWFLHNPQPTAWSQSSLTWRSRPSSTLVPKPSLVQAPRIPYVLLRSHWCPPPIQPHVSPCTDLNLFYSSLSFVSPAWRFLSHLSIEQANARSPRAGSSAPPQGTHSGVCSSRYTETVLRGQHTCLPAPGIHWGPCAPLFTLNRNLEEKFKLLDFLLVNSRLLRRAARTHLSPLPFPGLLGIWLSASFPPLRIHSGRAYIPTCLEGTHIAQQLMVQTLDSERPGFKSFLSCLWLGVNGQSFPGSLSLGFLLCKMGMKTVHLPYRFILRTKWDTMYSVAHS